jgi:predicted amidohydrolase YtcJ
MIEPMRGARAAIALLCLATAAGCSGGLAFWTSAPVPKADLVLRGGAVYTLDAVRTWAESIAIRGDEIVYVGSDTGAERFVGSATKVVDLRGAMVLPGFQDAHVHPISSGIELSTLNLNEFDTPQEYVEKIAAYAAENPDLPWLVGGGWTITAFPNAIPHGSLINAVVPDRPVAISSADGHSLWANSKALEMAGITRDTPDPPGGRIDRDPDTGEAVGALQESATELVTRVAPPITDEQAEAGLRRALQILNALGITSFQEADVSVTGKEAYRYLNAYRALDERGELSARVITSLYWDPTEGDEQISRLLEARADYTGGRRRATTVKIFQDGVIENHTAALLEPYIGGASGRGMHMVDPETLKSIVTRLDREGFQVHFHAIGDGAIRACLDAVETARLANGTSDGRHHISHIELFDPDDIPRFRALDVVANFQPAWAYADPSITKLTVPFIGAERARWIYPIGSMLRSGAVVVFGSDWSVSTPNPLEEIQVAVTRQGTSGGEWEVFLPEERIDLHDALAAFTINAAYVNHQEDRTGSIEVGKLADLVVLDRNLFEVEPSAISDARVVLTLLGGEPVYGDLTSLKAR